MVIDAADDGTVCLTMYVGGASPASTRALVTLREICEREVPGRYQLQVVDVYQEPTGLRFTPIVAVPTVVRHDPVEPRWIVGDLGDEERVVALLLAPARAGRSS